MNIKKIIKEEINDFEWADSVEPTHFVSVPDRLQDYLDGRLQLTSNLNILINDRSKDWYEYLGEYATNYYKESGKSIPMIDMYVDWDDEHNPRRYSSLGIFMFTGINDNLRNMFGEPIYHDHFGEGFDGEWNEELDDYDEPEIQELHASYMLDINGHTIHIGYDHRGTGIFVPEGLSAQVVSDEIMKPIITKYIDEA